MSESMRGVLTVIPGRSGGSPCFADTGAPVWAVAGALWGGDSVEQLADDYGITRADILVGCWFLGTYGTEGAWWNGTKRHSPGRIWLKRWGPWARDHSTLFWLSKFDEIPDPPNRDD